MTTTVRSRHWASCQENTWVFGIWLLFWVYRLFGRWPFRLCMYPVVSLNWLLRRPLRQASYEYLHRLQTATGALGHPPSWRDSLRHVALFAETMLDKLLAVSGRYPFATVQLEGLAEVQPGGLIVTAHLGCLELCRALAERLHCPTLNVLVHTRHAAQFNRILQRLNPQHAVRLLEVSEVTAATAVLLDQKIQAGEFVIIAGDRIPVTASQTVTVDFLGHPAPFPVGPYVLASLLKCPLYFLACLHTGQHYTVRFECLAERVLLPRGKRQAALEAQAEHYVAALTRAVQRAPYDWFNFFPFWDQIHAQQLQHPAGHLR